MNYSAVHRFFKAKFFALPRPENGCILDKTCRKYFSQSRRNAHSVSLREPSLQASRHHHDDFPLVQRLDRLPHQL
jgi:hypothetical protein